MPIYKQTTEITNIDDLLSSVERDIEEVYFGDKLVFTVWGEYDGVLPAQYSANGSALADYRIYGAAGGVGDRTVNMFDKTSWNDVKVTRGTVNILSNGIELTATANDAYTQTYSTYASDKYIYPVIEGSTYTLSWDIDNPKIYGTIYIFTGSTTGDTVLTYCYASAKSITFTIPNGHRYLCFRLGVMYTGDTLVYTNIMLTEGSTAPAEYVPYGYEVDMSVSDGTTSTTTPIYIGSDPLGEDEYVDYGEGKVYRRTANLFDISAQTPIDVTGVGTFRTGVYLGFLVVGQYTLTFDVPHNNPLFITTKNGSTYTHIDVRKSQLPFTFLVNSGDEIIIRLSNTQTFEQQQFTNVCVTPGTTPPETFVPYLQSTDPPIPLPALPTVDGTNIVDYAGQSAAPTKFYAKYRKQNF